MKVIFTLVFLLLFFFASLAQGEPVYFKEYFANKELKAEGWMQNGKKVKYWKYYNPYGVLKAEGHYLNGEKTAYWFYYSANGKKLKEGSYKNGKPDNWWAFYDNNGVMVERCQFKEGIKNGFRVVFVNEEPKKVEKFEDGAKINEWTNYASFIMDNGSLILTDE